MRNQLLLHIHWNHLTWTFKNWCGWTGPSQGRGLAAGTATLRALRPHSVHCGHTRNCGPACTATKTECSTHPFFICWPLAPSFVLRAAGFWSPSRKSSLSEKPGSEVLWSAPQCFKKKIQLQKKDVTYGIGIKRHILLPTPFPNVRSNSSKSIKPSDVFDRISRYPCSPVALWEKTLTFLIFLNGTHHVWFLLLPLLKNLCLHLDVDTGLLHPLQTSTPNVYSLSVTRLCHRWALTVCHNHVKALSRVSISHPNNPVKQKFLWPHNEPQRDTIICLSHTASVELRFTPRQSAFLPMTQPATKLHKSCLRQHPILTLIISGQIKYLNHCC